MTITAITTQTKLAGRYSVFVDGSFAFGIEAGQLLELGLVKGQEITAKQLAELKSETQLGYMFDKTLNLLSIRPRSEWELRDYLKRKKQPPAAIEIILNKLTKLHYVDDVAFAKRWVENRQLLKPSSTLKLKAELKQKRIADSVIHEVLKSNDNHEAEALNELIERKAKRYPDQRKLMQYLARQGFRYEDIKRAIQEKS